LIYVTSISYMATFFSANSPGVLKSILIRKRKYDSTVLTEPSLEVDLSDYA